MNWRAIGMLSVGHWASDFYPGMLSPLLPLLSERYGWSLAQLGILVMAIQITSNGAQLVFGFLNDRHRLYWFLWAGPLLSAIPFMFLLNIPSIPLLVVVLAFAGIGVAMYHPIGAVAAGHLANEKNRGLSMALFTAGGSVGVTTAPLAVVGILAIGESWMWLVVVPAILTAVYFVRDRGYQIPSGDGLTIGQLYNSLTGSRRELFLLWMVAGSRAMVYTIIGSFLPMLYIARGATFAESSYALSAALLAGMVGLFLGGHFSDRYGRRLTIMMSQFAAVPMLYGFLHTRGPVSLILLLAGMLVLSSTIPVNIILAQQAAPRLRGMASAIVMGLSFFAGAVAAPPFGALADAIGISGAMNVLFITPILGGAAALLLRKE